MSILSVIPFGKDGTDGDSPFTIDTVFPYHDEMTLEELRTLTYLYFAKEWADEVDNYESLDDWAEQNSMVVEGGWVILTDYIKIINVNVMCSNDGEGDAVNQTKKIQVQNASNLMVD